MKYITMILLAWMMVNQAGQDIYTCKTAKVNLYSSAPIEDIEATANTGVSVYNAGTGELEFSVPIRDFHFPKALMEEHFNENYLESDKYPKAIFKGLITDISKVNFTKDGSYPVTVNGDLSIHGVTNKVSVPGTITIKSGIAASVSSFNIKLSDYKISVPKLVKDNIAETINITVNCNYTQKI